MNIKKSRRLWILAVCGVAWMLVVFNQPRTEAEAVGDFVSATNAFLAALTPEQAMKARYALTDAERSNWWFIPRDRNGLTFKEMQPYQERLAFAMVSAALGSKGFVKATTIMSLEDVLRIQEGSGGAQGRGPAAGGGQPGAAARGGAPAGAPPAAGGQRGGGGQARGAGGGFNRDPQLHYITIFGEPSNTGKWGWRLEGHHISVNLTMDKGKFVGSTPTFLGSNPAEVRDGPRKGLRPLAPEEDLARQLLGALNANQKKTAITQAAAPNEIATSNTHRLTLEAPIGIAGSALNAMQKEMLVTVIGEYVERNNPEAAAATMAEIRKAGLDKVYFAWMGSETRGEAHYYRVQGPAFLIEYDNTQNGANHIHSVYRDLKNDWGGDQLALHYQLYHPVRDAE